MANYRYKVCKGRKVVAVATTQREAQAEALRIKGTFSRIKKVNPAGDFPYRPAGETAEPRDRRTFSKYLFTILSPKCGVPMAVYLNPVEQGTHWFYGGFSPDQTTVYAIGYLDGDEYSKEGYFRQHMDPGLMNYKDQGLGTGPAMYLAGPLVLACIDSQYPGTFSPKDDPSDHYAMRTEDAIKAWANLDKYGLVRTVKEGRSRSVQQLDRRTVLDGGYVLHAPAPLWRQIIQDYPPREGVPYVPPASGWETIDLYRVGDKHVVEMLRFCSQNCDYSAEDYLAEAIGALAKNESCLFPVETFSEKLKVPVRNPAARRNPLERAADRKWAKGILNARKWGW